MQRFLPFLAAMTILIIGLVGCSNDAVKPSTKLASVTIKMSTARQQTRVPVSSIKKIRLDISGVYMTSVTDTFDYVQNSNIEKTYQVPIGIDRDFILSALDINNTIIYTGKTTQSVVAGANSVIVNLYSTQEIGSVNFKVSIPNVPVSMGKLAAINFSIYEDGQSPALHSQISEAQINRNLDMIAPIMAPRATLRYYGSTDGLENIGRLAKARGFFVIAGAWIGPDQADNLLQANNAIATAKAGYADMVDCGYEVIRRKDIAIGDANSVAGDGSLVGWIKYIKANVDVPVTYGDTDANMAANPAVVNECEGFAMASFYPFWNGKNVDEAVINLKNSFHALQAKYPNKKFIIGETGWPTDGDTVDQAKPTPDNARRYFTQGIAMMQKENIEGIWFSARDEKWKVVDEGPQGAYWGLFDSQGIFKDCYHEVLF